LARASRDGAALAAVVKFTAERFGRAIAMPNLKPAIDTAAAARAYRERILAALPAGSSFEPLLTLYLTDATAPGEIDRARPAVHPRCQLYPAGATTHSDAGVTGIAKVYRVLARMERSACPCWCTASRRSPKWMCSIGKLTSSIRCCQPLLERFPGLRVVFEHITTARAVEFVVNARRSRRDHHAPASAAQPQRDFFPAHSDPITTACRF